MALDCNTINPREIRTKYLRQYEKKFFLNPRIKTASQETIKRKINETTYQILKVLQEKKKSHHTQSKKRENRERVNNHCKQLIEKHKWSRNKCRDITLSPQWGTNGNIWGPTSMTGRGVWDPTWHSAGPRVSTPAGGGALSLPSEAVVCAHQRPQNQATEAGTYSQAEWGRGLNPGRSSFLKSSQVLC